jgi:hypothetical protein
VDNLTGTLTGQGTKLADQGSDMLSSLFGGGMLSKLSGILARFMGVGDGAISKLLGMLTPVIFGFLGQQQKSLGLGASGLANLLSGQRDNIRAAMPTGLGSMLSSAIPGVSQLFEGAHQTVTSTDFGRTQTDYEQPTHRETPSPSRLRWALPLAVALVALAAILMWANRSRSRESVGTTPPMGETGAGFQTSTSFVNDATKIINDATSAFAGIKDAASAEAAVPKLKDINTSLGGLRSLINQLPETAKASAKETIKPLVENLRLAAQGVLNIPGVGDTIRPYVDTMLSTLDSLIA